MRPAEQLAFLAYPYKKLFECDVLLAMLELLRHQPPHMGWPPRLLARINASQPQHQRRDLLAIALQILLRGLTGARRSRIASCRSSGSHTSSPARDSLARLTASRRFVFTRSPGFFGTSDGATTKHSWPRLLSSL